MRDDYGSAGPRRSFVPCEELPFYRLPPVRQRVRAAVAGRVFWSLQAWGEVCLRALTAGVALGERRQAPRASPAPRTGAVSS